MSTLDKTLTIGFFTALCLLLGSNAVLASEKEAKYGFIEAASFYQVSAELLEALSAVESRHRVNALNTENYNDSTDHGHMQINTCWKDELEKYSPGAWERLRTDAKFCTFVGAWVLRHYVDKFGHNWDAVSGYHTNYSIGFHQKRAEQAEIELASGKELTEKRVEILEARIARYARVQTYVEKVYAAMEKIIARNGNKPATEKTKTVIIQNEHESGRPLKRDTK